MSKKPIAIIISITLGILLLILIIYYFGIQQNPTSPQGTPSVFTNFFPFGGTSGTNNQTGTTTQQNQNDNQENPNITNFGQKLRKLSSEPVSGAGTLDVKAGTIVRYMEKATSHIYETELFSPKNGRVTNTTIPIVYDSIWGNKNNSFIARYLSEDNQTINTYSFTIKQTSTTTDGSIGGITLPNKIDDVSVNGGLVFYLQKNDSLSEGYISGFDGTKKKLIWSSPMRELLSQFVNQKVVALTNKPAPTLFGYLYFVDTTNGSFQRILGDIYGLSTLVNGSATLVIYLDQGVNNFGLSVYDVKNKTLTKTSPSTFPEKCVWSTKENSVVYCAVPSDTLDQSSLTNWYMGINQYKDNIWKYDLKNNTSNMIENLSGDSGQSIDVTKPLLSENEQYLVFINKIDNSLWSLDLTQ